MGEIKGNMNCKKVSFENLYPIIERTIQAGNEFSFCAFGSSMLPFIRNGKDLVTLGPVSDEFKKNDVIFYRRANGQFVLHRIVAAHEHGVYDLCGDNQGYVEKGISSRQIIAKLVRLERNEKEINLNSFPAKLWYLWLPAHRFLIHVKCALRRRIFKIIKK